MLETNTNYDYEATLDNMRSSSQANLWYLEQISYINSNSYKNLLFSNLSVNPLIINKHYIIPDTVTTGNYVAMNTLLIDEYLISNGPIVIFPNGNTISATHAGTSNFS